MPVSTTYPGIYIQEAASSVHTITAAPTNIAVFIGYTHPLKTLTTNYGQAVQIFGFNDYQRGFGGFVRSAAFTRAIGIAGNPGAFGDMAQAVNQFFLNGGTEAYIVALPGKGPLSALTPATLFVGGFILTAVEVTDECSAMTVSVNPIASTVGTSDPLADIVITYGPGSSIISSPPGSPPGSPPSSPPVPSGAGTVVEPYRRVSLKPFLSDGKTPNPKYIGTQLAASALVTVSPPGSPPGGSWTKGVQTFAPSLPGRTAFYALKDYTDVLQEDTPLDKVPVFNLMILPGIADNSATWASDGSGAEILSTAIAFCERKLAFLIMDPPVADSADGTVPPAAGTVPAGTTVSNMIQNTINQGSLPESKNAALYFPYLLSPDPITGSTTNAVTGQPSQIPPAATVAGIYASTDLARGVWKAPAGFQAQTNNVTGVVARGQMTDQRQGVLNPLGVNCLRSFPNIPTVVFGARTLVTLTDEQWRYVPVRRMALFLEQSLYSSLKWVVFEPNADPLWSAIRMSINAFMLGLFKQGAFQGTTPSQAFSVQCDENTTTQTDIDSGVVNIVVGFAPLKPAEFVVITITQLAGQAQT